MGARFVWINALVGGVFAVAVDAKQRLIGQHLADLGVDLGNISTPSDAANRIHSGIPVLIGLSFSRALSSNRSAARLLVGVPKIVQKTSGVVLARSMADIDP
jgi:hypothetical protein